MTHDNILFFFIIIHRDNKIKEYFCETNLLSDFNEAYIVFWMSNSYVKTYEALQATGTYMKKVKEKYQCLCLRQ